MTYTLPFTEGQKIIELGGGPGGSAMFHPNLDCRPGPGVDIVADLNEPLPVEKNEYDGVFCKFMIEHISRRKIRNFIAEVHRILKPGGRAVFVTANLLEQARMIAEAPALTDDHVGMIFGDQNYSGDDWRANAHYTGFSPESAGRLFREAGFEQVVVVPWPQWRGDMVIEARKKEQSFDKTYFHGGFYAAYRDDKSNWLAFQELMKLNPTSILELGCARGYILKRFQDSGIPGKGLDISHHCQLTRVCNGIVEWDWNNTPWPFADKEFDLCYAVSCPELTITDEMKRVSQRQLLLPKIEGNVWDALPPDDGLLKVNLGSFSNMFHGWVNLDELDLAAFAREHRYKFYPHDCTKALPFEANSVDLMYSSHMIEHLTYPEGVFLLRECHRVMKPGATLRLMCPDAAKLAHLYATGDLAKLSEMSDGVETATSQIGKLWALLFDGHKSAWDVDSLKSVGESIGFQVHPREFRTGHPTIIAETLDMLEPISLFVEMTR